MKRNNLTSQIALVFCSACLFCSTQAFADPFIVQDGDFVNNNYGTYIFVKNEYVTGSFDNYTTGTEAIRLGKDYLLNKFKSLTYRSNLPYYNKWYLTDDRYGILPFRVSTYVTSGSIGIAMLKNDCRSVETALEGNVGINVPDFTEAASSTITNGTEYCTAVQSERICSFEASSGIYGTVVLGMDFRQALSTYGGNKIYFSPRIRALIKKQKTKPASITAIELSELNAGFKLSKQFGFDNKARYSTWRDYVDTNGYTGVPLANLTYTVIEAVPYRAGSACAQTTYSKIPVRGKMLLESDYTE